MEQAVRTERVKISLSECTPALVNLINRGTWHPMGLKWWGPVIFVQRCGGADTGIWFVLSRWRWWWLRLLKWARGTADVPRPVSGAIAAKLLARLRVEYHMEWNWDGPRGVA